MRRYLIYEEKRTMLIEENIYLSNTAYLTFTVSIKWNQIDYEKIIVSHRVDDFYSIANRLLS